MGEEHAHFDVGMECWSEYEGSYEDEASCDEDLRLQSVAKDHEMNQVDVFETYEFVPDEEVKKEGYRLKGRFGGERNVKRRVALQVGGQRV